MAYNSTYTGTQIDTAIGAVQTAANAGGIVNTNGLTSILGNYLTSSSAANTYPTKTGSGASGTWEISITGTAGSVTWGNITNKPEATGGATTPVYWNGSGFTNCTAYGSASVNYATSAGKISNITSSDAASSSATHRRIWIAYSDNTTGRPAYDDSFTFETDNGTLFAGRCIDIRGATSSTMSNATTNPRIRFSESGSQAVYLAYTDYDAYRASKGLKVVDADGSDAGNVWLEAQGQMYSKGFNNTSSRTVKHNINNLQEMGEILDQLAPVTFEYNDIPGQLRYGLIFEDTIDILPTICEDSGESKTINYVDLVPILLKEIQSLRKRIKSLENK